MFLHTTNSDDQDVYTVLQVTPNGTSVSATVAGSITLDKGATIDVNDLVVSSAFNATPGGGDVDPGKGGTLHEAQIGETINAGGTNNNLNIHISSELFKNGDTLTINGFGSDDQITFDDSATGFVFGEKIAQSEDRAIFQFTDAAGDLIYINIQSDSFNASVIDDLWINSTGIVNDFNTIFSDGTGVDTIIGA